jgi:two-component system, chemotaxis family, sensor kinase CheA
MTLDAEMMEIAKVFFQESREGLDAMEAGLLGLDAAADSETINTIFRAAHSIKGGSATFGFAEVAGFTHGVETLLDEMRNGVRPVTAEAIQTLLQSCDCLREMIAATEADHPLDQSRIAILNADIAHILGETAAPAAAAPAVKPEPTAAEPQDRAGWRIQFDPVADLLRLRNEPTRMFAELARLGDIKVRTDVSRLPALDTMDPEACYLSWDIELLGQVSRQQLDDVFDWVDAGCRLEFTAIGKTAGVEIAPAAKPVEAPAAVPATPRSQPSVLAPKTGGESASIRVATEKLDSIINLVGELLITQSMLATFADGMDPGKLDMLRKGLSQLARNTRELQESVM